MARYAARRVPVDDVNDVLAETFLTAWRRLDVVPDDAVPWLFATARNHIANRHRSARRRRALHDRLINAHEFLGAQSADDAPTEMDGHLIDAIRRLPAGEREALMLVAWPWNSPGYPPSSTVRT